MAIRFERNRTPIIVIMYLYIYIFWVSVLEIHQKHYLYLSKHYFLWIATKSVQKSVLGISISERRNMLVAEKFIILDNNINF